MQAGFCEHVAMPVYKALSELDPALGSLLQAVQDNKERWEVMAVKGEEEEDVEDDEDDDDDELEKSSDEDKQSEEGEENNKVTRNL